MRILKPFPTLLCALFCWHSSNAQNKPFEIQGTQTLSFKSSVNNQDYELYIALPGNYTDSTKRFPVLYVLDGESEFPLAWAIKGSLVYEGYAPDMILVGIGWKGHGEYNRNRDFTSIAMSGDSNTGGAPQFLAVLKNEVIKRIEDSFRTDKINKTLYGGSLSGFFALYALFHEPGLFNGYIICSPSLQWDDEITFKTEKLFAEKNNTLNANLFISSSQAEEELFTVSNYQKFIHQLRSSQYEGMHLDTLVVDKMSHASEGAYALGRGLQFVYRKPELTIDEALLDKYVGHYEQDWIVTRKNGSLYVSVFGGQAKLYAETPQHFYSKGMPLTCYFLTNDQGKVVGCQMKFFSTDPLILKKQD